MGKNTPKIVKSLLSIISRLNWMLPKKCSNIWMIYEHEKLPDIYPNEEDTIVKVTGMYKDWFLDYASYVILERAVPAIEDGFKPVQRRILHSMKDLDDGRYNKVANIVGHTMQYHPTR